MEIRRASVTALGFDRTDTAGLPIGPTSSACTIVWVAASGDAKPRDKRGARTVLGMDHAARATARSAAAQRGNRSGPTFAGARHGQTHRRSAPRCWPKHGATADNGHPDQPRKVSAIQDL
jgi:hypothetical protein